MKIPDQPSNEVQRLQVLRSLNVLDTAPEERFDRLTRIAKQLFRVPIALVSLIDAERQWFKSCQGLSVRETHRDIAFCGHAILSDEPLIVPDARIDPRFNDNPLVTGDPKIRFYASTPLLVRGYSLGSLCLIDRKPRILSHGDTLVLRDLGKIVEEELLAGHDARLEQLENRDAEIQRLGEISDFLQSCLTIEEACRVITSLTESLFPHCSGGIFIRNEARNQIENMADWGSILLSEKHFEMHDCWGMRRGRIHWVTGDRPGLRCKHVLNHDDNRTDTLCIPMMAQGETLGLFYLSCPSSDVLSPSKQQLARNVAEQVALAIANLRLRQTIHHQSIRDSLTNLFNRHYLGEALQLEMIRAQRRTYPIGLVMLDLDYFNRFNDTYGREAGNLVLRAVSDLIQTKIRGSDIACRYGGEEMVIVLPEATLAIAQDRAEALRIGINQLQLHQSRKILAPVTASFGVVCYPQHGSTVAELLRVADAALYRAKAAGRNQVVTAP